MELSVLGSKVSVCRISASLSDPEVCLVPRNMSFANVTILVVSLGGAEFGSLQLTSTVLYQPFETVGTQPSLDQYHRVVMPSMASGYLPSPPNDAAGSDTRCLVGDALIDI